MNKLVSILTKLIRSTNTGMHHCILTTLNKCT